MGDAYPRIRLAAVQAAPAFLDREATVEKACRLIREAGAGGAHIVGFPESFIPGHPVWSFFHPAFGPASMELSTRLFKNSVEIPGPETEALCEAAAAARAFVVMGLTEKRSGTTGTLYNTQLFIGRQGRLIGKRQKLVPTVGERLVHTGGGGDSQRAFPSEFGPVSGLCCGENSNPLAVAVLAAQYTRVHVACWPHHFKPTPGYPDMPEMSLLVARNVSYTCKCFTISACGTVSPEMVELLPATEAERAWLRDPARSGGSAIVDPRGVVIAGPLGGDEEGILYADADLETTVRARLVHDFGGHYNRPDVFRLLVNQVTPPLLSCMAEPGPLAELQEPRPLDAGGPRLLPREQPGALGPGGEASPPFRMEARRLP